MNVYAPRDPFSVTRELRERLARAIVAQCAIDHPGLNNWLLETLSGNGKGALLSDPVVEGVPPFPVSPQSLQDLAGTLLHPATVAALDQPGEQRFPRDRKPYLHQLEAWSVLGQPEPRSVLVSSGTGSGKTECFLVPLIDSLARQDADAGGTHPLVGVQAIMLYPLNALIASQRERLSAWTRPFQGRLRFALYNSLLERRERASEYATLEKLAPEQVHDRVHMWEAPPPILVTNVTMLEYLTIRGEDRPILEKSQGKLRWIILDEAHSYIGSAAAEIALLLRRVLLAFGVEPRQVRFVATSATIGTGDSEGKAQLRRFLADLAGVADEQVLVITGTPLVWEPLGDGPDGALRLDSIEALERHPRIRALAKGLQSPGGMTLSEVQATLGDRAPAEAALTALAKVDEVSGRPTLPIRLHRFLRAVPGLWSCVNPACSGEKPEGWCWGAVVHTLTDRCPHCESLVLEIESCHSCGAPFLTAVDETDFLRPYRLPPDADEFAAASELEQEQPDEDDGGADQQPTPGPGRTRLIGQTSAPNMPAVWIDRLTGAFSDKAGSGLRLFMTRTDHKEGCCPSCNAGHEGRPALRPVRFGAPFLIGNAAPVLLEGVSGTAGNLPGEGRRLLSFTDSRQGTARFAANIEALGERNYVRAFIYHMTQKAGAPDKEKLARLDQEIAALERAASQASVLQPVLEQKQLERARAAKGGTVSWNDALRAIAQDPVVDRWIRQEVWSRRDPRFAQPNSSDFARFLLLRELARRPVRANSLETLGLARLVFPKVDRAELPSSARSLGIEAQAWREFLYLIIDRVRTSLALDVPVEDIRWIMPRGGRRRNLTAPGQTKMRESDLAWPRADGRPNPVTLVTILAEGLRLSLESAEDRSKINELLNDAWHQLHPLFETAGGSFALNLAKAEIAPVARGWRCPVTRRILTARAFGRTPYGIRPRSTLRNRPLTEHLFPSLPLTFPQDAEIRQQLAKWLATDETVAELRHAEIWSNLHDRAVLFAPYIRAEEHSAQQDAERLRQLEKAFSAGEINLLACSTTMEMGVDIGPVESVLMTNVPPSIANYRQRVGRAGRRGQGFTTALTLARDIPLDRQTFAKPSSYLRRDLSVPRVTLDAARIVQRHANALALGHWLATQGAQLFGIGVGRFFGLPATPGAPRAEAAPASRFIEWLDLPDAARDLEAALTALLKGTILQSDRTVLANAREAYEAASDGVSAEWKALQDEAASVNDPSARKSVEFRLRRLVNEPLLAMLADRSVLPSHGFPGHVVAFVPSCRTNELKRGSTLPTRTAEVALREYAPGAEVVIDGLVWTSAGVTLNWQAPADVEGVQEVQALRWFWTCDDCGEADARSVRASHCSRCGSPKLQQRRFLEPAGFRVDWLAEPHAESDRIHWIEPMPPLVSVRDAPWNALLDPTLGRMRTSPDGLVFNHSMGQDRGGYHICLACGRASETAEGLKEHRSLIPRQGALARCRGNDQPFSIVGPLALGCEARTDVAELQLVGLTDRGEAWALASALRMALTRRLGVEASEIGLAVQTSRGPLDEESLSLLFYDTASGGAGLAVQIGQDVPGLFADAAAILDCAEPGCIRGCGVCILAPDLWRNQEIVDRRPALLRCKEALRALSAPVADPDLEGPRLSRPVADAIVATPGKGEIVTVFSPGEFDIADLEAPPLPSLIAQVRNRGGRSRLAIPQLAAESTNPAWRLGLRDAAIRLGFELALCNVSHRLIALRQSASGTIAWTCEDPTAHCFGADWGIGRTAPVISGRPFAVPPIANLDPDRLLPAPGATIIEPAQGMRVPLDRFGNWFVDLLRPDLAAIEGWRPGHLARIVYGDRYVRSPLVILLVTRALAGLRDALRGGEDAAVELRTAPPEQQRMPRSLWHDYVSPKKRDEVLRALASRLKLAASFGQAVEHARRLDLIWDNGDRTVVFLDKGFGFLQLSGRATFSFEAEPSAQAEALLKLPLSVISNEPTYFACRLDRSR